MIGYVQAMQQAQPMLDRYGGPVGVLGKIVGLGQEEIEAGIPWWAWTGMGLLAGTVLGYSFRSKFEKILEA